MDELHAGDARADHDEVLGPRSTAGRRRGWTAPARRRRRPSRGAGDGCRWRAGPRRPRAPRRRRRCRPPRVCGPASRPRPRMMRTPWLSSSCRDAVLELLLDGLDAGLRGRRGRPPPSAAVRPISGVRPTAARAPPVAIMAFDGMQSQRWAAPPITSCSTIVTSAPRRAAWVAAVLPAGSAADDHEAQRHGGEATDPAPAAPVTEPSRRPLQSAWSCPAASCPGRPMPSPTASTGAASSPDRRWWAARSSRRPPTSCSGPRRAYAAVCSCQGQELRLRLAVLRRLHGVLLRDLRRQRLPRRARSPAAGGRPTARASAAARPATTWTATSPAARALRRRRASAAARCNGTAVRLRPGPLRPPQGGLHVASATATATTSIACIGPIQCRVVTLHRPVADRAQLLEQRRAHRQQHPRPQPALPAGAAPPIYPVAGDWDGDGTQRHRVLRQPQRRAGRSGRPSRPAPCRRSPTGGRPATSRSSATGTATAATRIGIFREAPVAPLPTAPARPRPPRSFPFGVQAGDIPVVGRLERRRHRRHRHLPHGRQLAPQRRHRRRPGRRPRFRYGVQAGDIPVVGDWNGDGVDGVGDLPPGRVAPVRTRLSGGDPTSTIAFGAAGRHPGRRRLDGLGARQHRRLPAVRGHVVPARLARRRPAHPGPVRPAVAAEVST